MNKKALREQRTLLKEIARTFSSGDVSLLSLSEQQKMNVKNITPRNLNLPVKLQSSSGELFHDQKTISHHQHDYGLH